MKKAYGLLISITLIALFPAAAFAGGYGTAGCGLGSMAFGAEPGGKQILAATTNATFGSQTFGMTSGTSNCGDHGLLNLSKEREIFVEQNYASLVKEMAAGEGENLSTLAGLYGCPSEAYTDFGVFTQTNFDVIIQNDQTTPSEMLTLLDGQLIENPELSQSCPSLTE